MILKIIDGEATLLTEEEIKKEKLERTKNYWIKIKDTNDESFIINYDKNKVRPFMRDYISRLPGSLEIRYLTILIILVSIVLLFMLYGGLTRSYGKQLLNIEKQTKEISSIKDIITKKQSGIPSIYKEEIDPINKSLIGTGVFFNPMK